MVLDLVVESTHQDRHRPAAGDVAAHQHLTTQEVQLQSSRDQRHADVVVRQRACQVETEDRQLDGDERGTLAGRQDEENQGEEAAESQHQQRKLDPAALQLVASQEADQPVGVQ